MSIEKRNFYNNQIGKLISHKSTENDKFLQESNIKTYIYITIEANKDHTYGIMHLKPCFKEKENKKLMGDNH